MSLICIIKGLLYQNVGVIPVLLLYQICLTYKNSNTNFLIFTNLIISSWLISCRYNMAMFYYCAVIWNWEKLKSKLHQHYERCFFQIKLIWQRYHVRCYSKTPTLTKRKSTQSIKSIKFIYQYMFLIDICLKLLCNIRFFYLIY